MAKLTFEEWKKMVNIAVEKLAGLSADDLPDCPYYDWYTDGVRPVSAARKAIKRAKEE